MFVDASLTEHLESASDVQIESAVFTEINMNIAENISVIGNYKNRPAASGAVPAYATFAVENENTATKYYFGYTDSDNVLDGGYDTNDLPASFISNDTKKKLLFSLEDCFLKFRPRSGINKAMFYGTSSGGYTKKHYIHNTNANMMKRPRYYMAHKDDKFKYWTSYRTEAEVVAGNERTPVERGISKTKVVDKNEWYIDDAAPFITYKGAIPVNRVILKMQTHVGTYDIGKIYDSNVLVPDPFYDAENTISNRVVPVTWKIEYLDVDGTTWQTLKSFTSADNETSPLIGEMDI